MTMIDESIIDSKLSALITTLIDKTREGKVSWSPTINDGEFLAAFSRYVVSIQQSTMYSEDPDSGRQFCIDVALLDQNGKIMEVTTSFSGGSLTFGPGRFDDYENLYELFILARRSAHNVAESLDTLLQELESR